MRRIRLFVALFAAALTLLGASAGPAHAIRDPFIVCVTEPCGPQLPDLPDIP